jgi:hypothetical protein
MFRLFPLLFCCVAALAQDGSIVIGTIQAGPLKEISGVAVSRKHPGILYVHNDSGDDPRFFAISNKGVLKREYRFKGVTALNGVRDCEDIAIGPGPVAGKSYVYLADIGDNAGMRASIEVYRFEEPSLQDTAFQPLTPKTFTLQYPDGPRDAETILIDPLDRWLYILSKREDSISIYMAPLDFGGHDTLVLQTAGKLFFEGKKKEKWLVSGDVSRNGRQVLLKTMRGVYYWQRKSKEHLYEALQRAPVPLPYESNGQEEAICFSQDGKGYIIIAEGKEQPVRYFKIPTAADLTTMSKQSTGR